MTENRTWTAEEARAAVASALKGRTGFTWVGLNWEVADLALAGLGISGDVTLVPGRLEQRGWDVPADDGGPRKIYLTELYDGEANDALSLGAEPVYAVVPSCAELRP